MANFKILLGLLPKTEKIEATEAALIREHNEFVQFKKSEELNKYQGLDAFVNSEEFASKKSEIEARKFQDTQEFQNEQEYLELKKSKNIKDYYKVKDSKNLNEFIQIESSGILEKLKDLEEATNSDKHKEVEQYMALPGQQKWEQTDESQQEKQYLEMKSAKETDSEAFNELKEIVTSSSFKQRKKEVTSQKFKNTEEYATLQEFISLGKSKNYKFYTKYKESPLYKNFVELDNTDTIARYEELEGLVVNSEAFNEVKTYRNLSPKKKFTQSEEYKQQQEYLELKKSEKIVWYTKLVDSDKFNEIAGWKSTFSDSFDSGQLDSSKWMTNYFWGEAILQDKYSQATDKHLIADNNIEVEDGICKIVTREEEVSGKAWDPQFGFIPRNFNYTSGLISTGNSFRQKYGKFKAKVKLNQPAGVSHAFWMLADQITPHIDVFKFDKKKLFASNIWNDESGVKKFISKITGANLCKDFYIYELEWTPDSLVWKINGLVAATQTLGIPESPMYLLFSSGIYNGKIPTLPVSMEIDWVKCYKKAEIAN